MLLRNNARVLAVFLLFLGSVSAWTDDAIEVVQSVPVETTLALPGVRQTQEVWLDMIGSARATLDIEQFYISDQAGESLRPVIDEIKQVASRGVHVRLLMDSKFYKTYPETVNEIGRHINCEARLIDFSPGIQHAKFFIVDGKQSFIGSQNFDWRALSHIHEIGVRLTDPKVNSDLESVFELDWNAGKPIATIGTIAPSPLEHLVALFQGTLGSQVTPADIYLVASPKQTNPQGIPDSLSQVVGLMEDARSSIRIQVMDYSTRGSSSGNGTWRGLDDTIRAAAKRGVRVQLLVDVGHVQNAKPELTALSKLKNVEVRSVTIPQWSGGQIDYARLVHSKYLVVDGSSSWVGTENWSQGYFISSRNVGVIIHAQTPTTQLEQIFDRVWSSEYSSKIQ